MIAVIRSLNRLHRLHHSTNIARSNRYMAKHPQDSWNASESWPRRGHYIQLWGHTVNAKLAREMIYSLSCEKI